MKNLNFARRANADMIDAFYEKWVRNADDLDATWQAFFEGFELARNGNGADGEALTSVKTGDDSISVDAKKQARVIGAIYAYRSNGHTQACFNPLFPACLNPRLSLERLGLDEADLDVTYDTGNYLGGVNMTVRELLARLNQTYCGHIGVEYIHIQETPKRRWLQSRMEPNNNTPAFSRDIKLRTLRKLYEAEIFENFLHTRFVGQKRFSLEGAETLIPVLDAIIQKMPELGMEEMVLGMAHRGRLNVLANILGKSYQFIFNEFSENYIPDSVHGDGDVKYHLGYESVVETGAGDPVELRLAANPSHLEAVDPVVEGKARARQRIRGDLERQRVVPLLIHGDAAMAGQGIVAEVFNFSKLKGYRTGGTIHIVVNNQIGFTTDPEDARSSRYCTDVAKMIESPVFHVNGDDPLAVILTAHYALEYRKEFGDDVVIDMYCYRRHGHNESDEPKFTQPVLYRKIDAKPPKSQMLAETLIVDGEITQEEADRIRKEFEDSLNEAFDAAKKAEEAKATGTKFLGSTAVFQPRYSFDPVETAVSGEKLEHVAQVLTTVPDGFNINPKIARQLKAKWKAFSGDAGLDWAFGEALAFGTLMLEGTPVRLSGQDSERGTFSHRHAAWYDIETRERYVPLLHLGPDSERFCVYNSLLSEAAVLGFDFGYSLDYPQMLAIWEAQFGDFVNGAQVIIDQFITSSESKWSRVSGITLLLPHGYEGMGPEHSSARLERFLQACAENNIQVCNMTTSAQYFHCLRRQMKRDFRKPLIIMAPKSLLRAKEATSVRSAFTEGAFQEILDDPESPRNARRLIFCSGKVYYDLAARRREQEETDVALIRLEQLYPLNKERLKEIVGQYGKIREVVWCQEEPENMGAWSFINSHLEALTGMRPRYAGRDAGASPATGSLAVHKMEQEALVRDAFA
ncbi:MAG: 2-oxoglutarate dehydrogenase E1 component [Opitutales bacterium]